MLKVTLQIYFICLHINVSCHVCNAVLFSVKRACRDTPGAPWLQTWRLIDLTNASSPWNERYVEIGSKMEVYESYFPARWKGRLYFFPFFVLSVAWACWIENIWVLFIGFQDTLGIEQGRGAIVVTSEKEVKKPSNLFLSVFLFLYQTLQIEHSR